MIEVSSGDMLDLGIKGQRIHTRIPKRNIHQHTRRKGYKSSEKDVGCLTAAEVTDMTLSLDRGDHFAVNLRGVCEAPVLGSLMYSAWFGGVTAAV
jgi:hypothetical protein